MARAADGTMTLSGTFALANQIPVSSTINGYISDILTEITDSWSRSGKGAALAHLSMGSFKLTTMADGVALTDASTVKQVQNGTVAWADGGGTADAITATYSPAVTAVVDGMRLRVRATAANATTTPTFSPNGLTARTIKKLNGQALAVGDIAGDEHDLDLTYVATGTYWNLKNPAGAGAISATSLSASTTFTLSGVLTPSQITGNQNDYAPTNHATNTIWRISADADGRVITSIAGGAAGRKIELHNVGTKYIVLSEDDGATGTAANRILTDGANWTTIFPGGIAYLTYDGTSSRWRASVGGQGPAASTTMETGTSTNAYVTPGLQQRHPGHPKFWVYVTVSGGTPTAQTSFNTTSITDDGTGLLTVTIATDFSTANWALAGSAALVDTSIDAVNDNRVFYVGAQAAGTCQVQCADTSSPTPAYLDPAAWSVMGLGDQ